MLKRILGGLVVVLIIIQFLPMSKNKAGVTSPQHDISTRFPIPADVKNSLEKACNDCHSNNTIYPWYASVQPVGWWLNHHVKEGKAELNFNEFAAYSARKQYHKMEEVEEMVTDNKMPLSSYTLLHKEAKLSEEQKSSLISWSKAVRSKMEAIFPPDSLRRK